MLLKRKQNNASALMLHALALLMACNSFVAAILPASSLHKRAVDNIGAEQILNTGAGIVGNKNQVTELLNVNPQVGAVVNVLNSVTQQAKGATGVGASRIVQNLPPMLVGHVSNNIGAKQIQNTAANIAGSGNKVSSLLNVNPQVDVAVGVLNSVTQVAEGVTGGGAKGRGGTLNNIGAKQIVNDGNNIKGNNNAVSSLLNVNPQIGAGVNLLNQVTQTAVGAVGGTGSGCKSNCAGGQSGANNNIGGKQILDTSNKIVGSGNTISSLLNLNPQVNADVNALNTVKQTAAGVARGGKIGAAGVASNNIGDKQIQNDVTSIKGIGNTVTSLLNINPQIGVDVNLLNQVTQTGTDAGSGCKSKCTGGQPGANNNIGDKQIQNDATNIKGIGNTVSSLLNVNPQVNLDVNLLNSVKQTATSKLRGGAKSTGGGVLGGLPSGSNNNIGAEQIQNLGSNINGDNNVVSSLLNVNPPINADVNLLNSVTQTATGALSGAGSKAAGGILGGLLGGPSNNIGAEQIQNTGSNIKGDGNAVSSLLNVNPPINADVNLLNSVTQTATGALSGGSSSAGGGILGGLLGGSSNNIGAQQIQNTGSNIKGSGNTDSSLLNLNPQVNLDVDLLNSVTQTVGGVLGGGSKSTGGGILGGLTGGGATNNIGAQQIQNTGSEIRGDGNTVSSLLNVNPQVNADVNLLNSVTQTATGALSGGGANAAGGILGGLLGGSSNNIGAQQVQNTGSNINGNDNVVSSLLNVNPQVNADVNLLNSITQTATGALGGSGSSTGGGILGGLLGGGANNIGAGQVLNSGNNIKGDGNTVSSLLNVNPQINADVNALNTVKQVGNAVGVGDNPGGGSNVDYVPDDTVGSGVGGAATNNIGATQIQNAGSNIKGSGNTISNLLNVNPQIGVGVNALNNVQQVAAGAGKGNGQVGNNIGAVQNAHTGSNINGNNNLVSNLLNVSPQVNADVNLLNSVSQTATGALGGVPKGAGGGILGGLLGGGGNNIGAGQVLNSGSNIKGNDNVVSSLLNVNPQINADVNLLNSVTQTATGALGVTGSSTGGGILGGLLGGSTNNIGAQQIQNSGSNINGNDNVVSSLLNLSPQINADVNALNTVKQEAGNVVGASANPDVAYDVYYVPEATVGPVGGAAPNNIGATQTQNTGSNIKGSGNTVSSLLNVNPQVNLDVDLLNSVTQTVGGVLGGTPKSVGGGILGGLIGGGATNNIGAQQVQNTGSDIRGDGNTVSSLLNVNPQVNADVNLLNSVTQTATGASSGGSSNAAGGILGGLLGGSSNNIGAQQIQHTGSNINGNDNAVSSLLNVNPQVNADVNLLNSVTQTATGALGGSGSSTGGGILGGLLGGGANNIGAGQVLNSGNNIKGDGNTVSSLLNVNPQINADVNALNTVKQVGNVVGTGANPGGGSNVYYVPDGTVGSGAGGAATNNIGATQTQNTGSNIKGSGNTDSSLLNVNPQVNLDVNLLNSVTQTVSGVLGGAPKSAAGGVLSGLLGTSAANNIGAQQIQNTGSNIKGDGNTVSSLLNVNPQVNADVNLLNSVTQTATGAVSGGSSSAGGGILGGLLGGAGNNIGAQQVQNTGSNINGNDNVVSSLLNVNPQINADVNLLSSVTQTATGALGGGSKGGGILGGVLGGASNNIGAEQQSNSGSNIKGDGNVVSSLLNLNPQINVDANLLNQVQQLISSLRSDGALDCANNIGSVQEQNSGSNIVGDGNQIFSGINVSPQINADINILNSVLQQAGCRLRIPKPTLPPTLPPVVTPPTLPPTLPPTPPPIYRPPYTPNKPPTKPPTLPPTPLVVCTEVENNIGAVQTQNDGTNIVGDGNQVFSGVNVNPQVNLGVNLLNNVQQSSGGGRRVICRPIGIPPTIPPTTTPHTLPPTKPPTKPTYLPPTKPPTQPPTLPPTPAPTRPPVYPPIKPPTKPTYTSPPIVPTTTAPPVTPPQVCIEVEDNIGATQEQNTGTNIVGDSNQVFSGVNVSPQVNLGVNLLNNVLQSSGGGHRLICRPIGIPPTLPPTATPPTLPPTKPPTKPTYLPPTKPPIYIPPTKPPTQPPTLPPTPAPTRPPVYPPTKPTYTSPPIVPTTTAPPVTPPQVCIEVEDNIGATQEQNTGTNIVGDGNKVSSGVNVNPQVNLGVNLLNNVQQSSGGGRRVICRPIGIPPTLPPTATPPTLPPTKPTYTPPTKPPITPPPRRCYRRLCRRWRKRPEYCCCSGAQNCPPTSTPANKPPIVKPSVPASTPAPLPPTLPPVYSPFSPPSRPPLPVHSPPSPPSPPSLPPLPVYPPHSPPSPPSRLPLPIYPPSSPPSSPSQPPLPVYPPLPSQSRPPLQVYPLPSPPSHPPLPVYPPLPSESRLPLSVHPPPSPPSIPAYPLPPPPPPLPVKSSHVESPTLLSIYPPIQFDPDPIELSQHELPYELPSLPRPYLNVY